MGFFSSKLQLQFASASNSQREQNSSRAACQLNKGNQDVDLRRVPIDQYADTKINGRRFVQYLSCIFICNA